MPDHHVFIVRARREPREIPAAPPEWRFWVEHHPGGEQGNFSDFPSALAFVGRYLTGLDLRIEAGSKDR